MEYMYVQDETRAGKRNFSSIQKDSVMTEQMRPFSL